MPDEGGLHWLWIGVGLSALVLLFTVVWTVKVLADIQAPGTKPRRHHRSHRPAMVVAGALSCRRSGAGFSTANEIHIPVGQPVRLKLIGGDVIHSFWVPQLAGKMDAIPGQINETWIEADSPAPIAANAPNIAACSMPRCSCGWSPQTPADFAAWRAHQLAATGRSRRACGISTRIAAAAMRCAARTPDGTLRPRSQPSDAAPDHRARLLPNDPADLAHWIADPQSLKPGNLMPAREAVGDERAQIVAYLTDAEHDEQRRL